MRGGSGRWLYEVYRRMESVIPVVLSDEASETEEFDKNESDLIIRRSDMQMQRRGLASLTALRDYRRLFREVKSLVREFGITEIHAGKCLPEGWLALMSRRFLGLPYVCYVHGEDVEIARTSREYMWMVKRVLRSADSIIANSHNTRRLLLEHWPLSESNVQVVHPGVDTEFFRPDEAGQSEVFRGRMGWEDRQVVMTAGRLQKRKGHDKMIEALPKIIESNPDLLYVIVGGGDEYLPLSNQVERLGVGDHVCFLREISDEDLLSCYQCSDLFILPNRSIGNDIEGFGMVLVEAQACGTPVIAGDSGGTRETMVVGKTGWIIDCTSPANIAHQINECLALGTVGLARMGGVGRKWTVENLDWTALAKQAQSCFANPSL